MEAPKGIHLTSSWNTSLRSNSILQIALGGGHGGLGGGGRVTILTSFCLVLPEAAAF